MTHLFVMQSTTKEQINEFLEDVKSDEEPFPPQMDPYARRQSLRQPLAKCLMAMRVNGRGY